MFRRIDIATQSKRTLRSFGLTSLMVGFFVLPTTAHSVSTEQLMTLGGVKNMVLTVAIVNKAMREASENPMDQWRRKNVANAVAMMPIAMMGLAQEFKSGKLGNSSLPLVQAMMGSFVDTHAADNYKKFLKNPDKNLIPKVGNSFPKSALANAPNPAGTPGAFLDMKSDAKASPVSNSPEIANLNPASFPKTGAPGNANSDSSLTFDDTAKKGGLDNRGNSDSAPASAAQTNGDIAFSDPQTFVRDAVRDLNSVEAGLIAGQPTVVTTATSPNVSAEGNEEFFLEQHIADKKGTNVTVHSKKLADKLAKAKHKASNQAYEIQLSPKYWMLNALVGKTSPFYFKNAFAEASGNGNGNGNGNSNSNSNSNGTNQSGESGAKAADILISLAAMMAAISPMVATSIEASANKDIAKINTKAQIEMSQISAKSTQFLAEQQRGIALSNAQTAQEIAATNQQATTQRLSQQLTSLDTARKDANGQEDKRTFYEQQLNNERIAIAKQQMQQSTDLANTQFRAQLTAQGLSSGFANSIDSSNGIKVNRGLGTSRGEAAPALASNSLGNALGAPSSTGVGLKAASLSSNRLASNGLASTNVLGAAAQTSKRGIATSKLLAGISSATDDRELIDPVTGQKRVSAKAPKVTAQVPPQVAFASLSSGPVDSVGKALRGIMRTNVAVRGSSPANHIVATSLAVVANSDLNRLLKTTTSDGGAFSNYLTQERTRTPVAQAPALTASGNSGHGERGVTAYNAPTIESISLRKRGGAVSYSGN